MTETLTTPVDATKDGGGKRVDRRYWTVAYRKPRSNRFHRIDLKLTWKEASELAAEVLNALEGYQVYTTTTLEAEQDDYVCDEDKGNILSETGRRVRISDNGVLPEGVVSPA